MAAFFKKKQFWGALIGIALLGWCLKDIRLSEIRLLLSRLDLYSFGLCLLSGCAFMVLKGMRWQLMISPQKKIPMYRAITLYSVGQLLGILMPALTGQVGRVMLFSRKEDLRKTYVFSAIVLEVLFDAISLITFMFVASAAFAFPDNYRYLSFVVGGVTFGLLLLFYLMLHFRFKLEDWSRRHLRQRWPGFYIGSRKFMRSFTKGIALLRSSQHLIGTLAYSMASWTAHMFVVWNLIKAFGFEVPFATAAVIMVVNTIVLMVPLTPGNAGTFELAVSKTLSAFSVGQSDAVLFALALHIVDLVPVFLFGYLFLQSEKTSLREIQTGQEEDIILDHIDDEGSFIEEEST